MKLVDFARSGPRLLAYFLAPRKPYECTQCHFLLAARDVTERDGRKMHLRVVPVSSAIRACGPVVETR